MVSKTIFMFSNSLEVLTELTESYYTLGYNSLQKKQIINTENQPKKETARAESGSFPNVRLLLSPRYSTLPALIFDNIHRVLPIWKAPLKFGSHGFYWGFIG